VANLIKKYGLPRLVDITLDLILNRVKDRIYRNRISDYGVVEALLFPKGMDYYSRYTDVARYISQHLTKNKAILDVGAGGRGGISYFLPRNKYFLTLLDRKRYKKKPWVDNFLVGDGAQLPFGDDYFDIIVSVATLEHIPVEARKRLLSEMKRVGKKVILHFPCQDNAGIFVGQACDRAFQEYHKKTFGVEDDKTAEHLSSMHPQIEELRAIFPSCKIYGRKNGAVWLQFMMFARKPIIGFFAGFAYLIFWRKNDNKPPYYECMVVYQKNAADSLTSCKR
jgi:hypothetical protein